jgi:hypothetical protein
MLDNTITLAYDAEGDGNPVDVVIRRYQEYTDRSVYVFPDAESGDHNVTFYRTLPKASGNFKGVARVRQKLSIPVTVDGVDGNPVASAIIIEWSGSVPKGCTEAMITAAVMKGISLRLNTALRQLHIVAQEI